MAGIQRSWLTLALTLSLQALWLSAPALAADKSVVAARYATEGAKAYEGAKFHAAAELYLKAWKADAKPEYLWFLARSEMYSEQKDLALEHYKALVATPGVPAERLAQAREYIDLIEPSNLNTRIHVAETAAAAGLHKQAAQSYLTAYQMARDRWDVLLFKAAVEEQEAKQFQEATAHFEEYLKRASSTTPERPEAVARLDALRRQARGEPVTPTAETISTAAREDRASAGKTLLSLGSAVALLGLGSYVWTRGQQNEVEGLLTPGGDGKIHSISLSEARDRVGSVNDHVITSIALGSAGLAAAGIGAWLLLRPDVSETAQGSPDSTYLGMPLLGVGGAVALVGLGSYAWTRGDQSALEAKLHPGAGGKIRDISSSEARTQVAAINGRIGTSLAMAGTGVAAAGVGAWLLWRPAKHVALLPGPVPGGLTLSWRF